MNGCKAVTVEVVHENGISFHVEDGKFILDEFYGFGDLKPSDVISEIFPEWMLEKALE